MMAGGLKRRITLQQHGTGADELGQPVLTWVDVATIYASIEPLSGRELLAAQAVQSEVSHKITIRYQPQFANPKAMAAMRIIYNSRVFNIHASIDVNDGHRMIELSASEGLNDG